MRQVIYIISLLILSACGSHRGSVPVAMKDSGTNLTLPPGITRVSKDDEPWQGQNKFQINPEDTLTAYGQDLIANTSFYLGPKGKVAAISNGMNCQNCHLDAGTLPFSNNYGAVASTYPRFRDRSGSLETISKRVNDCLQRSLNGKSLDTNSHEMKAILSYMYWLGKDVPKGQKPRGSGIVDLPYLDRPADSAKGRLVYMKTCVTCHGPTGAGRTNPAGNGYTYPPLWGKHSYNTGAGLFRISRFAGYVKNSMPFNLVNYKHPLLSDEEAWDVAAFVNSRPRPTMDISLDWPNISKKPVDHPFGPYTDGFSEVQHKFGPFKPIKAIIEAKKDKSAPTK